MRLGNQWRDGQYGARTWARRRPITGLGNKWKGWHAFRRGLATNLYALGVQPKTIQAIPRHARVETTTHHYVILEQQKAGDAAMRKLERAVNYVANVQRAKK